MASYRKEFMLGHVKVCLGTGNICHGMAPCLNLVIVIAYL